MNCVQFVWRIFLMDKIFGQISDQKFFRILSFSHIFHKDHLDDCLLIKQDCPQCRKLIQ
ncbi:hypothetical protein pb186bvf_013762 [Paramecium bursaria]